MRGGEGGNKSLQAYGPSPPQKKSPPGRGGVPSPPFLPLIWSTPPISSMGRLDQPRPLMSRVPDMSVLSTSVWVQQAACKGCKGKRGLRKPSSSHPEKPSSSRQKRVFLRFDPIGKNGGFCPYTPYKAVSTRHTLGKACKGCKGKRGLPEPLLPPPQKTLQFETKRSFF